MVQADRTANRHRCSGRVDQGVRVILRQGTRQTSDRKLAIRSALPQYAQTEDTSVRCLDALSGLVNSVYCAYCGRAAAKEPMELFTKNTGLC
jgi:hypothetical protein